MEAVDPRPPGAGVPRPSLPPLAAEHVRDIRAKRIAAGSNQPDPRKHEKHVGAGVGIPAGKEDQEVRFLVIEFAFGQRNIFEDDPDLGAVADDLVGERVILEIGAIHARERRQALGGLLDDGDEVLDPRLGEIDDIGVVDFTILSTAHFEIQGVVGPDRRQTTDDQTADQRLAPLQLAIVDGELEQPVGAENDEFLGPVPAEIERLVQPHILEIAVRQHGEDAEFVDRLRTGGFEDLPTERHRVGHLNGPEIQGFVCDLDAIGLGGMKTAAVADGGFEVIDIDAVGVGNVVHCWGPLLSAAKARAGF